MPGVIRCLGGAHRRACRRVACSAARARISSRSTLVGRPSSSRISPSTSTRSGPHTRREGEVPWRVDVVVVPGDHVAGHLGEEPLSGLQPLPGQVRRGQHVVLAQPDVGQPDLLQHVGADAVRAQHDRVVPGRGPGVAHRVVHVGPGVVGDRARRAGGRGGRSGRAASRRRARPSRRAPASASISPSATWTWTPTPRSPARLAAASSVSSLQVKAAWIPDPPAPARRRKRSFSARPRRAPLVMAAGGQSPARKRPRVVPAVGHAVGDVDPDTHLRAGVGDDRERAVDGVRRLVVVDDGRGAGHQRLGGPEERRPAQHLQVERGIQPPPDLLQDLQERRPVAAVAPACRGPAPSRGGGGRRPGPA